MSSKQGSRRLNTEAAISPTLREFHLKLFPPFLRKKCSPIRVINHCAYLPYSNDKNSHKYQAFKILAGIGCHPVEGIVVPSALPVERHCHHRVTLTEPRAPLAGAELQHPSDDGSNETLQAMPSELGFNLWKKCLLLKLPTENQNLQKECRALFVQHLLNSK